MAKGTPKAVRPSGRPWVVDMAAHSDAGRAKSATAGRSRPGRGHPCMSERGYDAQESIVLRAVEQYRRTHHKRFMTTMDYLSLFRERGWLNESAITL